MPKILVFDIDDYYQIYSDGRVFSKKRNKFQTPHVNMFGYLVVKVHNKNIPIHRLLATHFIDNPNNLETVNHKDKNKLNNNLENLEWCSRVDNVKHGLQKLYKAVSPEGVVVEFKGQAEFCKENGLIQPNFSRMLAGARRSCQGWTRYEQA